MAVGYRNRAFATLGILAFGFSNMADAHEHDTSHIPEGETVSLEPMVSVSNIEAIAKLIW
jgi:hypothetical protein